MNALRAIPLLLIAVAPLQAQRSLHWSDVHVEARLSDDGTLRVRETQTIVFTGDWNGGERTFDFRPRQRFQFGGMQRLDSVVGAQAMREGTVAVVDGYDFTDRSTLRWRSRLPSDPPFDATPITYVLEYSWSRILMPEGETWVLNHDFGFADRSGAIDNFTVHLALDSAWQPTLPFTGTWQARDLPPGEGFVVHVPLRYVGSGNGPDVSVGADPIERALLAGIILLLSGSFARRLYHRERSMGRLEPLAPPQSVDEKWLAEHVLSRLPEVIGAAWDNKTSASEVAAVLARMVADGRMKSDVREADSLFADPVLHLELLVDRDRFHGHERRLVDALFKAGETTTDTASVRERYKKSGFDPAERIRKPLKSLVQSMVPGKAPERPSALPTLLAFLGAMALLVAATTREPADAPVILSVAGPMLLCYFIALGGAIAWRNRVHDVFAGAMLFALPLTLALFGLLSVLATGVSMASAPALAGLALLFTALANSVFNQARSRESEERIALRRRLAVARAYFADELRREQPRLQDAWFPYLIAFGLGKEMDKWFHAFGPESATHLHHAGSSSGGGGGGSGNGGGGWTGFGGGGGFSGGGASASWTSAASSMAAGVSAPSSSSSGGGGGGGGGGSSGGGGGGGW